MKSLQIDGVFYIPEDGNLLVSYDNKHFVRVSTLTSLRALYGSKPIS